MATTLYDFYQGKLPSLTERAKTYEQAGLGSASSYGGTAEQNTALLSYLQKAPTTSAPSAPSSAFLTPEQYAGVQQAYNTVNAIPTDTLNKTTPVVQQPAPPPQPQNTALQDVIKAQQTTADNNVQTAQTEQGSILSNVEELLAQQGQESARRGQLEQDLGVVKAQTAINEIDKQINSLVAQAKQMEANAEDRLAPTFAIYGEQAQINRQLATQTYGLSAVKAGLQGDLALAQQNVDRAIAAEFDPLESKIRYQELLLDLNRDKLTAAQQEKADLFTLQLQELKDKTAEDKANKQAIYDLALQGASLGNVPNTVLSQLTTDPNMTQQRAIELLSPYISTIATEDRKLELAKANADIAKINADISNQGINPITNPDAGQYAGLLSTILGSGKFTKAQANAITYAINNGEDPVQVIKNQAKNLLSGQQETTVSKYEAAKSSMEDLQSLLNQFYAQGGDTNIFKGNYEKVLNKLGAVNDPGLVDLATQIQSQLQVYRNAVSGTAYSEQEGADIASIFPGITKGELLNNTIVKARLQAFDSAIDGAYRSVLGSAYDTLKTNEGVNLNTLTDEELINQALGAQNTPAPESSTAEGVSIPSNTLGFGSIGLFDPTKYVANAITGAISKLWNF